ncbi:hypothetical protein SK128_005204, partial [Halocaridina rubra]
MSSSFFIEKRWCVTYHMAFFMVLIQCTRSNYVENGDFFCNVEVGATDEAQVGFLTPENDEGEFIFCFLNKTSSSTVTLHFHEYYLYHTN